MRNESPNTASLRPEGHNLFRRKANQIEAVRITFENIYETARWCGGDVTQNTPQLEPERPAKNAYLTPSAASAESKHMTVRMLHIPNSLKGIVVATVGDWVMKSEDGKFDRMTNKEFIDLYEFVKTEPPVTNYEIDVVGNIKPSGRPGYEDSVVRHHYLGDQELPEG